MKLAIRQAGRRSRRGLSALEITISTVLLLLTARITITAIDKLQRVATTASSTTKLQEEGERAMASVRRLLQRSGFSGRYPYTFVDGDAGLGFEPHSHEPPVIFPIVVDGETVVPTDVNREIVFLAPIDNDAQGQPGHGVPDVDGDGNLVWDPVEHSLVVIPVSDDTNELQYRRDGGTPETIASGVESFVCTSSAVLGSGLPDRSVQVELVLRARDEQGRIVRYSTRAVVRLRNG